MNKWFKVLIRGISLNCWTLDVTRTRPWTLSWANNKSKPDTLCRTWRMLIQLRCIDSPRVGCLDSLSFPLVTCHSVTQSLITRSCLQLLWDSPSGPYSHYIRRDRNSQREIEIFFENTFLKNSQENMSGVKHLFIFFAHLSQPQNWACSQSLNYLWKQNKDV